MSTDETVIDESEPEPTVLITCPDCGGYGTEECPECGGTGEGETCDECDGTGLDDDDSGVCVECDGSGYYECEYADCGSVGTGKVECDRCDGQGEIEKKDPT